MPPFSRSEMTTAGGAARVLCALLLLASSSPSASGTEPNDDATSAMMDEARKVQSFDLRPTASLLFHAADRGLGGESDDDEGRADVFERRFVHPDLRAVYSTLQTLTPLSHADPASSLRGVTESQEEEEASSSIVDRHNDLVAEFNSLRHLSRHEIAYRTENGLDLMEGWDGIYRFNDDKDEGQEEEGEGERSLKAVKKVRPNSDPHDRDRGEATSSSVAESPPPPPPKEEPKPVQYAPSPQAAAQEEAGAPAAQQEEEIQYYWDPARGQYYYYDRGAGVYKYVPPPPPRQYTPPKAEEVASPVAAEAEAEAAPEAEAEAAPEAEAPPEAEAEAEGGPIETTATPEAEEEGDDGDAAAAAVTTEWEYYYYTVDATESSEEEESSEEGEEEVEEKTAIAAAAATAATTTTTKFKSKCGPGVVYCGADESAKNNKEAAEEKPPEGEEEEEGSGYVPIEEEIEEFEAKEGQSSAASAAAEKEKPEAKNAKTAAAAENHKVSAEEMAALHAKYKKLHHGSNAKGAAKKTEEKKALDVEKEWEEEVPEEFEGDGSDEDEDGGEEEDDFRRWLDDYLRDRKLEGSDLPPPPPPSLPQHPPADPTQGGGGFNYAKMPPPSVVAAPPPQPPPQGGGDKDTDKEEAEDTHVADAEDSAFGGTAPEIVPPARPGVEAPNVDGLPKPPPPLPPQQPPPQAEGAGVGKVDAHQGPPPPQPQPPHVPAQPGAEGGADPAHQGPPPPPPQQPPPQAGGPAGGVVGGQGPPPPPQQSPPQTGTAAAGQIPPTPPQPPQTGTAGGVDSNQVPPTPPQPPQQPPPQTGAVGGVDAHQIPPPPPQLPPRQPPPQPSGAGGGVDAHHGPTPPPQSFGIDASQIPPAPPQLPQQTPPQAGGAFSGIDANQIPPPPPQQPPQTGAGGNGGVDAAEDPKEEPKANPFQPGTPAVHQQQQPPPIIKGVVGPDGTSQEHPPPATPPSGGDGVADPFHPDDHALPPDEPPHQLPPDASAAAGSAPSQEPEPEGEEEDAPAAATGGDPAFVPPPGDGGEDEFLRPSPEEEEKEGGGVAPASSSSSGLGGDEGTADLDAIAKGEEEERHEPEPSVGGTGGAGDAGEGPRDDATPDGEEGPQEPPRDDANPDEEPPRDDAKPDDDEEEEEAAPEPRDDERPKDGEPPARDDEKPDEEEEPRDDETPKDKEEGGAAPSAEPRDDETHDDGDAGADRDDGPPPIHGESGSGHDDGGEEDGPKRDDEFPEGFNDRDRDRGGEPPDESPWQYGHVGQGGDRPDDEVLDRPDDSMQRPEPSLAAQQRAGENYGGVSGAGGGGGAGGGSTLTGGMMNSYQTAPLSQGYGTHYATVWVGSPSPQRKSVIVDTGSHFTAFPCKGCRNCGEEHHTDLYFDPDKSVTFRALNCDECEGGTACEGDRCVFSQSYTEGSSWQAYQAIDNFFCGGNEVLAAANKIDSKFAIPFMFGCQTSETGLFVTQLADGIMGMSAHEATLPKKMYDAGKIEHNLFTLCFRRELNVSKKGVLAGTMTLGGIDTRLDSSPMVYAKNSAASGGWYTVFVKNIFIRTNGGQSANGDLNDANQHVMKIPLNLAEMNSGKGVIVDSGTTDTYLHKNLAGSFAEVWRSVTGVNYSNAALSLSKAELMSLPTVLIQLQAYDDSPDPSLGDADSVNGLVGETLSPASPRDILLAIPATHYMEFSPSNNQYTSRLYFTESRGGVIGANAMQGHNVLFDWENGRVGFAESSCDYADERTKDQGTPPGAEDADEGGIENDCRLGSPALSESCMKNVDLGQCSGDLSLTLHGFEKWSMVVENAGTPAGKTCTEVAKAAGFYGAGSEPPTVACEGEGLCYVVVPCEVTCASATAQGAVVPAEPGTGPTVAGTTGRPSVPCEEGLWGACEYSCTQSKITAILMSDGVCHEELHDTRPCHIEACGRSDPCRVPFVVHSIMVFPGANPDLWTKSADQYFATALRFAVDDNALHPDEAMFLEGDVNVLMAAPWYASDEAQLTGDPDLVGSSAVLGMKVVVEISIFNPNAKLPLDDPMDEEPSGQEEEENSEDMSNVEKMKGKVKGKFNEFVHTVQNKVKEFEGPPMATCEESDLYPLARTALDVHTELGKANFMTMLLRQMREHDSAANAKTASAASPFQPIYDDPVLAEQSKVVTSWTIRTEINKPPSGMNVDTAMYYATNIPLMAVFLGIVLCMCSCGMCCGRSCGYKNALAKHRANLMRQLEERRAEERKGKYSKVGAGPEGDDDHEGLGGHFQFTDRPDSSNGDVELAKGD